jgi:hypothetical protein
MAVRRGLGSAFAVIVGVFLMSGMVGCGETRVIPGTGSGGGSGLGTTGTVISSPTPSGTYTVTVTGTSTGVAHSVPLTMVVE